jgi:hypothetical protein
MKAHMRCDYSPPFSCSRIASCMVSYAKLRPTLMLSIVVHTSSAGAPIVALRRLALVGRPCDIGLIGTWLGVLGCEPCCRPDVTSTVALFSQLASSSSVRATPSPPTSGRLSGTFTDAFDLLRPSWNRCRSPPDAEPCDEALLRLLNRLNLPRGSGDKRGGSRGGSPGKLGGSIASCVEVVVRKNWNSGTVGESVAPVGDVGLAPSSLILSFFFNRSLSVMVLRKLALVSSFALPAKARGYAAGDLILFENSFAKLGERAVLAHYSIFRVFLYLRRVIVNVAEQHIMLAQAVEL